jgi:hypothetical protein
MLRFLLRDWCGFGRDEARLSALFYDTPFAVLRFR